MRISEQEDEQTKNVHTHRYDRYLSNIHSDDVRSPSIPIVGTCVYRDLSCVYAGFTLSSYSA